MFDDEPVGATPIDADEAEGLIPGHIHTRGELNAWEQQNIIEAARWVRTATEPALRESTILGLHKRMFDRTWEWAGRYRTSEKNIGVCWADIGVEVRKFVESIPKLVETAVTSSSSGSGGGDAIGTTDPEFSLNRGTEQREVAVAE